MAAPSLRATAAPCIVPRVKDWWGNAEGEVCRCWCSHATAASHQSVSGRPASSAARMRFSIRSGGSSAWNPARIASATAETGRQTMPGIRVGLRDQVSSAWFTVGWQAMRESMQRVAGMAPVFAATRVCPGTSRTRP